MREALELHYTDRRHEKQSRKRCFSKVLDDKKKKKKKKGKKERKRKTKEN
jgi:hypothetical protein